MTCCDCCVDCKGACACSCCDVASEVEKSTTVTLIEGVAPVKKSSEGSEKSFSTEGGNGCKCGSNCQCDPCNC